MVFLADFFLNSYYLKDWLDNSSTVLKLFWAFFLIFTVLSLIYYILFIAFASKKQTVFFLSEYKTVYEKKWYFNLLQVLIAASVFGFSGIVMHEYLIQGSKINDEISIVRLALIFSSLVLAFLILAYYFFYKFNYHPKLLINHILENKAEIVTETPSKKQGFGKLKSSYNDLTIYFHCITEDSDRIPENTSVRVLEMEDMADTLLVTKYY